MKGNIKKIYVKQFQIHLKKILKILIIQCLTNVNKILKKKTVKCLSSNTRTIINTLFLQCIQVYILVELKSLSLIKKPETNLIHFIFFVLLYFKNLCQILHNIK